MQEGGFQLSEADPCMLYKEDERGVCIIIIYIDDMLITGKEEAIDAAIMYCKAIFKRKIQQVWKIIWVCKVMMVRKLVEATNNYSEFGETIWRESCKEENDYYTWDTRVYWWKGDDISKVDANPQSMYRSGVEHCCISPSTADLISQIL